jgi:hypothetical protein
MGHIRSHRPHSLSGFLSLSLACSLAVLGCATSSPAPPETTGASVAALGGDAGGPCVPSVTVNVSAGGASGSVTCAVTVNGTTCDCSDCACIAGAVEACVGVPGGGLLDDAGLGIGLPDDASFPGLPPIPSGFDAGLPGIGSPLDGGWSSAACSASAVAAAKAQFCSDVDSWLASHGSTATLDCSAVGSLSFPVSGSGAPPSPPPALVCSSATQAAFAAAQSTLSGCNPVDYVGWNSSAQLQLFEDGVCEP